MLVLLEHLRKQNSQLGKNRKMTMQKMHMSSESNHERQPHKLQEQHHRPNEFASSHLVHFFQSQQQGQASYHLYTKHLQNFR